MRRATAAATRTRDAGSDEGQDEQRGSRAASAATTRGSRAFSRGAEQREERGRRGGVEAERARVLEHGRRPARRAASRGSSTRTPRAPVAQKPSRVSAALSRPTAIAALSSITQLRGHGPRAQVRGERQPVEPVARAEQQRGADRGDRAAADQPDERELRRAGEHQQRQRARLRDGQAGGDRQRAEREAVRRRSRRRSRARRERSRRMVRQTTDVRRGIWCRSGVPNARSLAFPAMDAVDRAILSHLQDDGRLSNLELAERDPPQPVGDAAPRAQPRGRQARSPATTR